MSNSHKSVHHQRVVSRRHKLETLQEHVAVAGVKSFTEVIEPSSAQRLFHLPRFRHERECTDAASLKVQFRCEATSASQRSHNTGHGFVQITGSLLKCTHNTHADTKFVAHASAHSSEDTSCRSEEVMGSLQGQGRSRRHTRKHTSHCRMLRSLALQCTLQIAAVVIVVWAGHRQDV